MKSLKEGIKERGCPNRPSQDFCNIPFFSYQERLIYANSSIILILILSTGTATTVLLSSRKTQTSS